MGYRRLPFGYGAIEYVVDGAEADGYVLVSHGRWLAETIPGALGVFPPDAGHTSSCGPGTSSSGSW